MDFRVFVIVILLAFLIKTNKKYMSNSLQFSTPSCRDSQSFSVVFATMSGGPCCPSNNIQIYRIRWLKAAQKLSPQVSHPKPLLPQM